MLCCCACGCGCCLWLLLLLSAGKSYGLDFPLLSDSGGAVSNKYGSLLDLGDPLAPWPIPIS